MKSKNNKTKVAWMQVKKKQWEQWWASSGYYNGHRSTLALDNASSEQLTTKHVRH